MHDWIKAAARLRYLAGLLVISATAAPSVAERSSPPGEVPSVDLPASFIGSRLSPSGGVTGWHLDLWPDQVFHLRRHDPQHSPYADLGRWRFDPEREVMTLRGRRGTAASLRILANGDLRFVRRAGEPVASDRDRTLTAWPLDPAKIALPLVGMFRPGADPARFEECLTGRSYPVAMTGAYIDVERAYARLEQGEPGLPVLAVLEGRLRTPAVTSEQPRRMHLVIERLSRIIPGQSCERHKAEAPLTNTYWKLLAIAGEPVQLFEGRREPHLIMRAGAEPVSIATVGCNRLRSRYDRQGTKLRFVQKATTTRACPPRLAARESALSRALAAAASWQVNGNTLELFDAAGTVVLMAEAVYLL